MPVNPFFNFTTITTEQTLVEDLIVEAIQIYGHSVYYIKREDVNIDHLLGEDRLARYSSAREIEVYLKSNMAFGGASETMSKFGLVISDQATFLVAVRRFTNVWGAHGLIRPRENDIIAIEMQSPVAGGTSQLYLFEIRFVEDKEQLFQLGKLYTYELQCELWNYSHERLDTGNNAIDIIAARQDYQQYIPIDTATGTFIEGETVYQGGSFIMATFTGVVMDVADDHLLVKDITGSFHAGDTVVGVTSAATAMVLVNPDGAIIDQEQNINPDYTTDPVTDNTELQSEPHVVLPITNPRFS